MAPSTRQRMRWFTNEKSGKGPSTRRDSRGDGVPSEASKDSSPSSGVFSSLARHGVTPPRVGSGNSLVGGGIGDITAPEDDGEYESMSVSNSLSLFDDVGDALRGFSRTLSHSLSLTQPGPLDSRTRDAIAALKRFDRGEPALEAAYAFRSRFFSSSSGCLGPKSLPSSLVFRAYLDVNVDSRYAVLVGARDGDDRARRSLQGARHFCEREHEVSPRPSHDIDRNETSRHGTREPPTPSRPQACSASSTAARPRRPCPTRGRSATSWRAGGARRRPARTRSRSRSSPRTTRRRGSRQRPGNPEKPRTFSDFGEASLSVASILAPSLGPANHLCTSSRDRDANIARVDSYDVTLKRS